MDALPRVVRIVAYVAHYNLGSSKVITLCQTKKRPSRQVGQKIK